MEEREERVGSDSVMAVVSCLQGSVFLFDLFCLEI